MKPVTFDGFDYDVFKDFSLPFFATFLSNVMFDSLVVFYNIYMHTLFELYNSFDVVFVFI